MKKPPAKTSGRNGKGRGKKRMGKNGKAGCGCLIGILVVVMILAGVLAHPLSLKFIAKQLRFEEMTVPADAVFVPRFAEDRKGELYSEAFRQYFAGNGRIIYIEDDRLPGADIANLVTRMAKERGIREGAVRPLSWSGQDRTIAIKEKLKAAGLKKVLILVPEYASRRYHLMYDSTRDGGAVLYMVKPVSVSYFQKDRWWRDELSRSIVAREIYTSLAYYYSFLRKDASK